jgi:outer membrane murein-binding lipoprotein Lpp
VKYRRALIGLPLLVAVTVVHAETLYVIETLVVNVSSAPDSTAERVANIKSGDAVEVIERQNDQVHVRLANGTEGWVKKSYLATDEPVIKRLNERTAEVDKLKQDVARLEAEVAAAKAASARAVARESQAIAGTTERPAREPPVGASSPPATASTPTSDRASQTNTLADPGGHEPPYFMTPPDAPAHPVWHWALGSFVVALGLGFALGWRTLDGRIRRKYGGLRIY